MSALEDRRPVAATTTISRHPNVIGEDLAQLLLEHPGIELASIRLIPSTEHDGVGIAGRIGQIVEQTAEYACCHQLVGRPHTDFCMDPAVRCAAGHLFGWDEGSQIMRCRNCHTPMTEQRPDDDPAPVLTCDGRNCGGYPHE